MSLFKPRRTMETTEKSLAFGVCVWRMPNGNYIQNSSGDYLCMQGKVGDKKAELKMKSAVKDLGVLGGNVFWLPGFRQISENEWCDQMERMIDGKIPDPIDVYRQIVDGEHT